MQQKKRKKIEQKKDFATASNVIYLDYNYLAVCDKLHKISNIFDYCLALLYVIVEKKGDFRDLVSKDCILNIRSRYASCRPNHFYE